MNRYFLQEVSIEGFRGINNEDAPLVLKFRDDAVNSVFAPNAGGKSSVFEAITYAITGTIPKLEALQDGEAPETYYVNRFHSKHIATIDLLLAPDDGGANIAIRVTRSSGGTRVVSSPSGHADPESLLKELAKEFVFLDYLTFQTFIADSPLNRGRSFASLLGLARISEHRQVLETLSNSANLKSDFELNELTRQVATAKQKNQEYQQTITTAYSQLAGCPLPDPWSDEALCVDAVRSLAKIPLLAPHVEKLSLHAINCDSLDAVIKEAEKATLRSELTRIVAELESVRSLVSSDVLTESKEQDELATLIADRDAALAMTGGPLLKSLYDNAMKVVAAESWHNPLKCPVCGLLSATPLKDLLSGFLSSYAEAAAKESAIAEKWASSLWPKRLEDIEAHKALCVPKDERIATPTSVRFGSGQATKEDLAALRNQLASLDTKRAQILDQLDQKRKTVEASLPPSLVDLTKKVEYARQLGAALRSLRTSSATMTDAATALATRDSWCKFILYASKAFALAEATLSTEQTNALQSAYLELFQGVMNNANVSPKVERDLVKESLQLRLDAFYGEKNVTAAALLSESYRNALAISIFLSAAQKRAGPARFILLDDVTSSFDAGHQWHLMEVLRTRVARPLNADGPQLILFSHDGLLEKYFDRLSELGSWRHHRLQGLSPTGRVYAQLQSPEKLKNDATGLLNAGNTAQAQPLIRQYIEYVLLQVIRKVGVPVPIDFAIRDTNRMVGNCLKAIDEAVSLQKRAGSLILSATQENDLGKVHMPAIVGNWVAHYETASTASVSPPALLGVLTATDQYCDCFKYDCKCGGTLVRRFYRSLESRACKC